MAGGMSGGGRRPRDPRRGIYSGFEGYRTPTLDDYREAFTNGIVVPDANVLLNLYRYTDGARDDLLSVLDRLSGQLWVPHQVLAEFWRNRGTVLRDPRDTQPILKEMSGLSDRAASVFRSWVNRVSLSPERATDLEAELVTGGLDPSNVVTRGRVIS